MYSIHACTCVHVCVWYVYGMCICVLCMVYMCVSGCDICIFVRGVGEVMTPCPTVSVC